MTRGVCRTVSGAVAIVALCAVAAAAAGGPAIPAVYPIQEQFVDANGVLIYTMSIGRGAPLLVLHGGPGASHDYFLPYLLPLDAHQPPRLHRRARLGAVGEARGRLEGYTVEAMVEDVEAVRAALGLGKINLLGHSYGGVLAQAYALKYRQNLDHLVLCSTFHSTKADERGVQGHEGEDARRAPGADRQDGGRGAVRPRQGLREEPLHLRLHGRRLGRRLLPLPLPEPPRPQLRPGRQRRHGVGPLPRDVGLARRVRHRRQPRLGRVRRPARRRSRCPR